MRQYGSCALQVGEVKLNTHSHYVILIAFPQRQWLHKLASILRLYIHCLSCVILKLLIHQENKRLLKGKSIFVPKIDHFYPVC